jgi:cell division protein FtsW (lipid II flippase)
VPDHHANPRWLSGGTMSAMVVNPGGAAATGAATVTTRHPRRRRNTEAILLFAAYGVSLLGFAQVSLVMDAKLNTAFFVFATVLALCYIAVHIAVRRFATSADPVLVPAVALLNGLGLTMIYRLDRADGRTGLTADSDFSAQLAWTVLGVVLFVVVLLLVREPRVLQRYTYTAGFIGLVLLILPLLPGIGVEINGARIWVRIPLPNDTLSFQPGELAKLFLIIFFAGYLVERRDVLALARTRVLGVDVPRGRDLGPILLAWLASLAVLIFERDLGTSLLFFGAFVAMLYIATERWSWLVIGGVLFIAGSVLAYFLFAHVQIRFSVWLNPFADEAGAGYQIAQSLYGFATGGILGTGLGQGYPDFVPYANTDFIAAAFGEELGLAGFMALMTLYAIVVERGFRTSLAARDPFGKLLAAGLSIEVGLQVFVVVGGVTRLIPLTGLTTPFLSYGGSSLVANWMLIALLIRISDHARRPEQAALPADPPSVPTAATA